MGDKFIVLSDIHGNLSALEAVIRDFEARNYNPDGVFVLGDTINYGMRPNEVIERLKSLTNEYRIFVNLFGNHERALMDGDSTHFSTERGKRVLDFTRSILTEDSLKYIGSLTKEGYMEVQIDKWKILFVHGSIRDPYWGNLDNDAVGDIEYSKYDYVFSGHSHIPHMIQSFYPLDNPEYRNRKRTVFLNPGSVGQPRNHNPQAQYLYMEISTGIVHFNSVSYDIGKEQSLFKGDVDDFYSTRLLKGI